MTEAPITAGDILRQAADIVEGARQQTHGPKERSFDAIADLWSAYLRARRHDPRALTGADVAQMMVLMKIARALQGEPVLDHWLDCCGYAAIAGELSVL